MYISAAWQLESLRFPAQIFRGKQSMDGKSVVVQFVEQPAVLRFFKGEI